MRFSTLASTLLVAVVAVHGAVDVNDPNSNPFYGANSATSSASGYVGPGFVPFPGFGTATLASTTPTSTSTSTTSLPYNTGPNLDNPNNVDDTDDEIVDEEEDGFIDANGDGYRDYEPYGARSVKRWISRLY